MTVELSRCGGDRRFSNVGELPTTATVNVVKVLKKPHFSQKGTLPIIGVIGEYIRKVKIDACAQVNFQVEESVIRRHMLWHSCYAALSVNCVSIETAWTCQFTIIRRSASVHKPLILGLTIYKLPHIDH